jgi:hypothetical protein
MPKSAPAVASNPAQNALPMTALISGAIGRKKPIAMLAKQVRRRKTAFATTSRPPRLAAAMRRLAYQRSAKTTIAATIRMNDLLFHNNPKRRIGNRFAAPWRCARGAASGTAASDDPA